MAGAGYKQQLWDLDPVSIAAVRFMVVLHLGIYGVTPREGFPFEAMAVMEKDLDTVCLLHSRGLSWFGQVLPASSVPMGCRSPGRAFATNVNIQKFPKYQVQDPGGSVSSGQFNWNLSLFPSWIVGGFCPQGGSSTSPWAGTGRAWAPEAPGKAQTALE